MYQTLVIKLVLNFAFAFIIDLNLWWGQPEYYYYLRYFKLFVICFEPFYFKKAMLKILQIIGLNFNLFCSMILLLQVLKLKNYQIFHLFYSRFKLFLRDLLRISKLMKIDFEYYLHFNLFPIFLQHFKGLRCLCLHYFLSKLSFQ